MTETFPDPLPGPGDPEVTPLPDVDPPKLPDGPQIPEAPADPTDPPVGDGPVNSA